MKYEIHAYKEEENLAATAAGDLALQWWFMKKSKYPLLFDLMRCVCCVPATSATSERCFSSAGLIVTEKRTRLAAEKVSDLVFLRNVWEYCEGLLRERAAKK